MLHEIHAAFLKAFNAGDLEGLVALYEPEAVFVTSAGAVTGHAAIREAYRGFLEAGGTMHLETLASYESGDIVLTHGRWSLTGEVTASGINTEVSRRQADGRWLFILDNPVTPQL